MAQDITHVGFGDLTFKRGDDGSLFVFGKATGPDLDLDQQICDEDWLKTAMPQWLATGANVREMHSSIAAGVGIELAADGDDWFLKSEVVDDNTAKKVERGVLKGYSIGIKGARIIKDAAAPGGRIVGGQIVEVSLVDRPANPTCVAEIAKSVNGGDLEIVKGIDLEELIPDTQRGHGPTVMATEVTVNEDASHRDGEDPYPAVKLCPACNGLGTMADTNETCAVCDGSGHAPEMPAKIQGANAEAHREEDKSVEGEVEKGGPGSGPQPGQGLRTPAAKLSEAAAGPSPDHRALANAHAELSGKHETRADSLRVQASDLRANGTGSKTLEAASLADRAAELHEAAQEAHSTATESHEEAGTGVSGIGGQLAQDASSRAEEASARAASASSTFNDYVNNVKGHSSATVAVIADTLKSVAGVEKMQHDPVQLEAVRTALIALIKAELDEMSSGEDNEMSDVAVLLSSLNTFLNWWDNEAAENETTEPFADSEMESQGDDTMAYIGLGVSADLIKSASSETATEETKSELRTEIRKALGVDEEIATYKAALSETEEQVLLLKAALDEVREMATPGGPVLRATNSQAAKSADAERLQAEAARYRKIAEDVTDPALKSAYLVKAAETEADSKKVLRG
jgi:hypothetical protein